jgi:predicted phosphoadenosine phosphosulfate sulfurtransferase
MVLVQRDLEQNVVEAASDRIIRIFNNGLQVHLSLSGGKDSICLASLVYDLALQEKIDTKLLVVHFVDEEAVFDDVDVIVREWRMKFMELGVKFNWWCMEFKHFNCFNQLTNDESFITWDRTMANNWVRSIPSFAITSHPKLKARKQTYQQFFTSNFQDVMHIVGLRTAESVQRLYAVSKHNAATSNKLYPIYDWQDSDVWRYIKERNLNYPVVYQYMYQTGSSRRDMRISQFFSIDTSKILVKMGEFYPDLMEKITKREPNAYLASLYWDSELFRRSKSVKKKPDSKDLDPEIDYRSKVIEFINNLDNLTSKVRISNVSSIRNLILKFGIDVHTKDYKRMYDLLVAGDPKDRTIRALQLDLHKNDWDRNVNDRKS